MVNFMKNRKAAAFLSTEEAPAIEVKPELLRLSQEAKQIDGENPDEQPIPEAGPGGAAPPLPQDEREEAREFFMFCRDTLSQAWPFVGAAYTDPKVNAIAGAWVPLANKYGWQLSALIGPEFMFAIALCGPIPELVKEQKAWKESERQRAKVIPKEAPAATPFAPTPGGNGQPAPEH